MDLPCALRIQRPHNADSHSPLMAHYVLLPFPQPICIQNPRFVFNSHIHTHTEAYISIYVHNLKSQNLYLFLPLSALTLLPVREEGKSCQYERGSSVIMMDNGVVSIKIRL